MLPISTAGCIRHVTIFVPQTAMETHSYVQIPLGRPDPTQSETRVAPTKSVGKSLV